MAFGLFFSVILISTLSDGEVNVQHDADDQANALEKIAERLRVVVNEKTELVVTTDARTAAEDTLQQAWGELNFAV